MNAKKVSRKQLILYLIPVILPLSLIQAGGERVGIFQMGDTQCDVDGQAAAKRGHIELIKKIVSGKYTSSDLGERSYSVAFPGDLIDGQEGLDNYGFWFWFLQCIPGLRKGIHQTDVFKTKYLSPLKKEGIRTFLCNGNHDHGDATESSLELIKKEHGSMYYAQQLENGALFLNCGCWPDKDSVLPWLEKQLEKKKEGQPVIIAFHFNILGNHNKWWTVEERENFLTTIKNKNVQIIMTGHDHETYEGSIEGIPVVCSGGKKLPVSLFDAQGRYEKTLFFSARQEADNSFTPVPTKVSKKAVSNVAPTKEDDAFRKKSLQLIKNDF